MFVELFRKTRELARVNDSLQREAVERARVEEALRLANQDLEQRVRDRTDALERADRRKDEFLAVLGHELRNPLAPIVSAIEVLEWTGVSESNASQARAVVRRQVRHMTRLIDDLLDVGRITSDRLVLQPSAVDLAAVDCRRRGDQPAASSKSSATASRSRRRRARSCCRRMRPACRRCSRTC